MIYEIINPSDKVTIDAEDDKTAAAAVLFLGEGRYGLVNESGDTVLPVFLFGGAEEWMKETYGDFDAFVGRNYEGIAGVLETALYASIGTRRAILDAMEAGGGDQEKALAKYNDTQRTSLTNIGARCAALAKHFRAKAEGA